jgi:hypothetical protein
MADRWSASGSFGNRLRVQTTQSGTGSSPVRNRAGATAMKTMPKRHLSKRTLGLMAALAATAMLTAAALVAGSYERLMANPVEETVNQKG